MESPKILVVKSNSIGLANETLTVSTCGKAVIKRNAILSNTLNETSDTTTGIVIPNTLALTTIFWLTAFLLCLVLASAKELGVKENPHSMTTTSSAVPCKVLTMSTAGGLVPTVNVSIHNCLTKAGMGADAIMGLA